MSNETEATTAEHPAHGEPGHVHGPECGHDHEHVHGPECGHDHAPRMEPIPLELNDLTPEGRAAAEQRAGRSLPDLPYTVAARETRPGAVTALTFEFERGIYLAEQQQLLEELARDLTLPGFRKGKAPLKLLQIRMGEDAVRSTMAALATNALRQEHAQAEFKFVTKPRVVDYTAPAGPAAAGPAPVSVVVEVETLPEVQLNQYTGLAVDVEDRPVAEEQVEQRIEQLRRQNAVVETAPAGALIEPTDTLLIKTDVANEQGEALRHMSQASRMVYDYQRDLPAPVAEQLTGQPAGTTVEADVPTTVTNRRGEVVTHQDHWRVEVLEIKKTKLPELDDEFAKDLGEHETLAALREKIRTDLAAAEHDRQQSEALGKLLRAIAEQNPFETPRSLAAARQYELIMQDQQQLARMGLRLDQVVTDTDKYLQDQRASAEELVKIQMLSAELTKRENLTVTEEDVDRELEAMAQRTGRKPLAIRARLEAQRQLEAFRENVARTKLRDWLLAHNTVNKVAPKAPEPGTSDAEPAGA